MADHFSDINVGEALVQDFVLSLKAYGSISKGDLVYLSNHTTGEIGAVSSATGTQVPVGQALKSASAGDYVPILVRGVAKVTASGSITLGTKVKSVAPGGSYVAASTAYAVTNCGIALQTLSNGDTGLIILTCGGN